MENACCFFGHRDAPENIKKNLIEAIEGLINDSGVTEFYVGNQGRFDSLVISALKGLAVRYPKICYSVVLAYLPENGDIANVNTVYPESLENVPRRFCIARRNDWLIDHSQYCICYVAHITGGAAQFMKKAQRRKRTVINIA